MKGLPMAKINNREDDIDSGNESGSEFNDVEEMYNENENNVNIVSNDYKPKASAFKILKDRNTHLPEPMCGEVFLTPRTSALSHSLPNISYNDNSGYDSEDELCNINGLVPQENSKSNNDSLPKFDSSPPTHGVFSTQIISPQKFFSRANSYENILHNKLNAGLSKKSKKYSLRYGKSKERSFLNFEKMLRLCQVSLDSISSESGQLLLRTVPSGV